MSVRRSVSAEAGGPSSEEYGLLLKAIEIVEIAKCRPSDEAQALVVDVLREIVRAVPKRARVAHISGCSAAIGECPVCTDITRLFRKQNGALVCGACMMDELLALMNAG
jgi:hypothetical protein